MGPVEYVLLVTKVVSKFTYCQLHRVSNACKVVFIRYARGA